MVWPQLEDPDLAEVRDEVEVEGVAVERSGLGLERTLSTEPSLEILTEGEPVNAHVGHENANRLLQCCLSLGLRVEAAPGRLKALAVAVAAVFEHVSPLATAAVRCVAAALCTRTCGRVALVDGAVLQRDTLTRSSSGAEGTRMSLPSRSTGVGHLPQRMSS